ncbi:unnamed protein product [Orchesella dallaii]|uniref:Peptidase S1 domain-containing protein n=1 Tax=Orchesella dallaii TaxID=48710 RepID=A0ABP1PPK7_9HEXA
MSHKLLMHCSYFFLFAFLNVDLCRTDWITGVRDIHTVYKNGYREGKVKAVNVALNNKSYTFQLTEDLEIQAFGSISLDCTSEVSCNQLNYPEPNQDGQCIDGYIIVEDSYGSQRIGCGAMKFGLPIRPSRNGRDLYIQVKGKSLSSQCTITCGETRTKNSKDYYTLPSNRHSGIFETKRCTCGRKNDGAGGGSPDHIVGGRNAGEFEYPYMASLVSTGTSSNICGASLINDRYVLTAGHCSAGVVNNPENYQLIFHAHLLDLRRNGNFLDDDVPAGSYGSIKEAKGYNLPTKTDADEDRLRLNIEKAVIHPLFYQNYQRTGAIIYDVAIYKLERRLNLVHSEYGRLSTMCLPKLGTSSFYDGDSMTVIGWGRPREDAGASNRILQELDVTIYNQTDCRQQLGEDSWLHVSFCGGFPEGKRDSCQGDSGSPSVHKVGKNHYEQIGLVSWGRGCARAGQPGVYSHITELNEWIHHTTQDAVWCSRPQST